MQIKLLSLKQIIYLGICAFGIQFASSLEMANTSSVYRFLGAASSSLPLLWLAAPISGLIMQPLIGQLSDDTYTRFGKRRPYLLGWGLITFICFCMLPFCNSIWLAAVLFWLIGCALNGCMEALRALIGDIAPNQQKTQAFSWQTILSGVGAGIAALLPWLIEQASTLPKKLFSYNALPFSIQLAFIVGGLLLIICIGWTCWTIQERPQKHNEMLKKQKEQKHLNNWQKTRHVFEQIWFNIKRMPPVIRSFIPTQIFTWIAIFIVWLYFNMAIAQHVYGLPVGITVAGNANYEDIMAKSTIDTGFYFGIYQFVSVLFAMLLPKLSEKIAPRLIHGLTLLIGALSLLLFVLVKQAFLISLCMAGFGIMWGSTTVLPLAIVAADLPRTKMGIYLGIFNITVTLPQIIVGMLLGPINRYIFSGHTVYAILLAGASLLAGGLLMIKQVVPLNLVPGKFLKRQWQS